MTSTLLAIALACVGSNHESLAGTALEHLQHAQKPVFRPGHSLPPLTRWGWSMPYDVRLELARHWGYALELGEATSSLAKQLEDPNSAASRLCTLAASDPKQYPLSVLAHRVLLRRDFTKDLPPKAWCIDPKTGKKAWSPEAPDSVFQRAAAVSVEPLKAILEKAPVAIVLNGGEYALSVHGHHGKIWAQDADVVNAKGERSWYEYISERKAHQEVIISNAFREACPRRQLYIFYYADGCPHRNQYDGWDTWAWDYKWMRSVSDLPSSSIYFRHFNSGWTGDTDMLTGALNGVAQQVALGDHLSYDWVNAGWTRKQLGQEAFGDLDRYTGYLKCYYTAGMIGGVAGYFAFPKGGFSGDVGKEPPHWLLQMMALARVHATFSHLDEILRDGELLPGPDKHRWSKDLPAYEFPTGDPMSRVLARKHRRRDEWIVTAWAAGGDDRPVEATIPKLGRVRLEARKCGTVYRATLVDGKPVLNRPPGD